jgi:succinate dehydrogenase / fumarate reductase flavoprotein subunit
LYTVFKVVSRHWDFVTRNISPLIEFLGIYGFGIVIPALVCCHAGLHLPESAPHSFLIRTGFYRIRVEPHLSMIDVLEEKETGIKLESKVPEGPLAEKWAKHKFNLKLVNPANKRKYEVIVVGTGLAGASAAAALAELGYNVKAFCFQDSPRRAHSIAAQGGINAAKNYQNDGDSIFRLFYDTIKGGDYRAREGNVHRLAEVSVNIIDQCVAQGVPFAREYGGALANRSFGGSQVSRTFYARGQTGQQLLLGAYSALSRQVANGKVKLFPRTEMLDRGD